MPRPDPSARARVLHRDEHLLVLDKPSGLPTTRPDRGPSLVAVAHALDPDAPRLHPSSRLDVEVTGVVTFARTERATAHLLRAREQGRYARGYLALVARAPEPEQGAWSASIGIDPRDRTLRRVVEESRAGAKPARTSYRVLWERPGCAALWLQPHTGRTHQLRVHAAHAGCPIYGDRAYGGAQRLVLTDGSAIAARRTLLHCARVTIPALDGDEPLVLEAPVPDDMLSFARAVGVTLELP